MTLNVLCVRVGQKYPPEYVYKLRDMVARHLKQDHNFYCITEHPAQVRGIDTIAAPLQIADSWCKIGLFCPSLDKVKMGDKCLYLDLDVVITGSLDDLIAGKLKDRKVMVKEYKEGGVQTLVEDTSVKHPSQDLWIVKDWRDPYNSSVMYWVHGQQSRIFTKFQPKYIQEMRGDQNLIAELVPSAKLFKEKDVLSYKFSGLVDKDKVPEKAKVVLFHGKPKMHDLPNVEWITNEWRLDNAYS